MAKGNSSKDKNAKGAKGGKDYTPRITNRKARFEYQILDKIECGIQLKGSEVKSIRNGQASIAEGFAQVDPRKMELLLVNVDIQPYTQAGPTNNHDPRRTRKLLARKREIEKLHTQTTAKGTTLIPLAMYFSRGKVKVELGVCIGKKHYDKRQDIKKRDTDRDIRRALSRKM